jgi:hypothetical protein
MTRNRYTTQLDETVTLLHTSFRVRGRYVPGSPATHLDPPESDDIEDVTVTLDPDDCDLSEFLSGVRRIGSTYGSVLDDLISKAIDQHLRNLD